MYKSSDFVKVRFTWRARFPLTPGEKGARKSHRTRGHVVVPCCKRGEMQGREFERGRRNEWGTTPFAPSSSYSNTTILYTRVVPQGGGIRKDRAIQWKSKSGKRSESSRLWEFGTCAFQRAPNSWSAHEQTLYILYRGECDDAREPKSSHEILRCLASIKKLGGLKRSNRVKRARRNVGIFWGVWKGWSEVGRKRKRMKNKEEEEEDEEEQGTWKGGRTYARGPILGHHKATENPWEYRACASLGNQASLAPILSFFLSLVLFCLLTFSFVCYARVSGLAHYYIRWSSMTHRIFQKLENWVAPSALAL